VSTTDVDEYDTKTEIWTPKAKIQRPVHNFAAAFVNSGMIYVMGGEKFKGKGGIKGGGNDPDLVFYDDVWEYSPNFSVAPQDKLATIWGKLKRHQ
jgi:hypothetical protein